MTVAPLHTVAEGAPAEPLEDEVPERRQPGHVATLYVEGEEPYEVRITNRERIAYEKTAARHKEWPTMETGRHFAMTFVCWAAAKRAGRTVLTFEQWQEVLEDWDTEGEAPADPTR